MIPYGKQEITESDIEEVERVLDLESEIVIDNNNETIIPNLPIVWTS